MTPLSGRPGQQYLLAAILIGTGVVLALAAKMFTRRRVHGALSFEDVTPICATTS